MIPKKATAIVFFCFSLIVAFFNILIGQFQYIVFIIPFALACLFSGKKSRVFEIIGLYFVCIYYVIFNDLQMGMVFLIVTSTFVYTLNEKKIHSYLYICITVIVIFTASYVRFTEGANKIVHAMLDCMFFLVGSVSIYCAIDRSNSENKIKNTPLDQKYINTLEELLKIAHESIDIIKRM